MMKKIALVLSLTFIGLQTFAQDMPEQYVRELNTISKKYSEDMHRFLKSLPLNTTRFNPQQTQQYCGIVRNYINDFFFLTDNNRNSLPLSYARMTRQDVIENVRKSKEMKILSKYNIQCDLN